MPESVYFVTVGIADANSVISSATHVALCLHNARVLHMHCISPLPACHTNKYLTAHTQTHSLHATEVTMTKQI